MKKLRIINCILLFTFTILAGCSANEENQSVSLGFVSDNQVQLKVEETFSLNDMVMSYYNKLENWEYIKNQEISYWKVEDPRFSQFVEKSMNYWIELNNNMNINVDDFPKELPDDKSLCIVVLGYQLNPDGQMRPELIGRCNAALELSNVYPNAYIAVTGGGTAKNNANITEADSMAEWLKNNGVSDNRIIIENKSLTTKENAVFTSNILLNQYPQINSLVVVTSDYHISTGCLLFMLESWKYEYQYNKIPFTVMDNYAYKTEGNSKFNALKVEADSLMDFYDNLLNL